jgi:hypothetical protein
LWRRRSLAQDRRPICFAGFTPFRLQPPECSYSPSRPYPTAASPLFHIQAACRIWWSLVDPERAATAYTSKKVVRLATEAFVRSIRRDIKT